MEFIKEKSQKSSLQAASIDLPHVCGYLILKLPLLYMEEMEKNTTVILSKYLNSQQSWKMYVLKFLLKLKIKLYMKYTRETKQSKAS